MADKVLLEELRKRKATVNGVLAGSIVALVIGFLVFIGEGIVFNHIPVFGLLLFVSGIIFLIVWSRQRKLLKDFIGEQVVEEVIREYIDLESYNPNAYISTDIIRDMSILPSHNQRSGSDLIQGTYKGNPISLCDLLLQQVTSTGKTTTVVTVFKGQFLSYGLKKELDGYVELQKKSAGKSGGFLKRLRNFGTSVSHGRNFEQVETENTEFNQAFDIRAEHPLTAFLVLTPQFMEKLLEVNQRYTTNFCFAKDRLYMAVKSNEDRFELKGSLQRVEDVERFRNQIRRDLNASLSLLDVLLSNDHLF